MWVRFPDMYTTDYYYMNTTYYDAVTFICKRNIVFLGYGLFANYNGNALEGKVQWQIGENGEKSEEFDYKFEDGDKDPEKKWHIVDIRNFGCKPVKVNEGEKITVKAKVANDNCRRVCYGYNGYKDRYSTIPDQEYDFDTEYS